MRTIILIAAMALISVAAQAGETRGLSTAAAPADAAVTMPPLQRQAQNDAPVAVAATPAVSSPERRYDDKGYYDDAGYHPSPRHYTSDDRPAAPPHRRAGRSHHGGSWSAQHIIAELHRYGIYW